MSKKPSKRFRVGMEVRIRFLDHVEDGSDPEDFLVYGRVGKVDRKCICVDSWCYTDPTSDYDSNVKRFVILRSAIIAWAKLADDSTTIVVPEVEEIKDSEKKGETLAEVFSKEKQV